MGSQVVLVSGSGAGIGRAVALHFAAAGASVVVNDIDGDKVASVLEEIAAAGGTAHGVHADVADEAACDRIVAEAAERFGGVDVLVNNAYWRRGGASTEDIALDDFERCWRVAVMGTLQLSRAAFPHLKERRGCIVNFGSEGSEHPPMAGMVDYAAAKSAVRAMTKAMARDWGVHGIRVNVVWPNAVTPLWERFAEANPDDVARFEREIALGRVGDADQDVAPVVGFLASDAARFITGQTIVANGGRTML